MKLVECIVLMEIPIQNSYGKVPTSLPNSSTAWIYVYCFFFFYLNFLSGIDFLWTKPKNGPYQKTSFVNYVIFFSLSNK